jgi:hypothetical protein
MGIAAYELWLTALEACTRLREPRRQAIARRAELWHRRRLMAARFMAGVAGARRDRWARLLRAAADVASVEATECLAGLAEVPRRGGLSFVSEALREAHRLTMQIAELVGSAALLMGGTDPRLARELNRMEAEAPETALVGDLIYLARAGSEPFRRMALGRLAFADDRRAAAVIREAANDPSPDVAGVALWARERGMERV